MKITIKTIKGEQFQIDCEEADKILVVKQKIQEAKGFEKEQQKLVHKGAPVVDEKTVAESNIKDGDFLVVIVKKAVPKTEPPKQPEQTEKKEEQKPVQQPPTTQQQPTTAQTTSEQPAQQGGQDQSMVTGQQYNAMVEEIMGMGFTKEQVQQALKAAFNNPERAIQYLLDGMPTQQDFVPQQPMQSQQPQQPQQPQQAQQQQQQQQPSQSEAANLLGNNPAFAQFVQQIQQNPALLQPYLQQLQQTNPQAYEYIMQNQQAFAQLLMPGGMANMGGQGQQPPGSIQVTSEEKAAIDRIASMGFDKKDAIEAFMCCDKNEEIALNYLLEQQSEGKLLSQHIQSEEQNQAVEESLGNNQQNPPNQNQGDKKDENQQ